MPEFNFFSPTRPDFLGSVTVHVGWRRLSPEEELEVTPDEFNLCIRGGEETVQYKNSGDIIIRVIDTGAGMTKEQLGKLFQAGVQFNANELQAGLGSGLGCHIAKGICNQHGGDISAESEGLGNGSVFEIVLPLYHVPDDALPESLNHLKIRNQSHLQHRTDSSSSTSLTNSDRLLRILVVDDALMNRKLLSRLLSKHGHILSEAKDGKEAVEHVKAAMAEQRAYDTSKSNPRVQVHVIFIKSVICSVLLLYPRAIKTQK